MILGPKGVICERHFGLNAGFIKKSFQLVRVVVRSLHDQQPPRARYKGPESVNGNWHARFLKHCGQVSGVGFRLTVSHPYDLCAVPPRPADPRDQERSLTSGEMTRT